MFMNNKNKKIIATLLSTILLICVSLSGIIMARELYVNNTKHNLIFKDLEPQSTIRIDKPVGDTNSTPDYCVSSDSHEMLLNSPIFITAELANNVISQSVTYSAERFNSNFLGYNRSGEIKNPYFFPITSGVIDSSNKNQVSMYSSTLISGYVASFPGNHYGGALYKEFSNEVLPLTLNLTLKDNLVNNLDDKTPIKPSSLPDDKKMQFSQPSISIEQSEKKSDNYALSTKTSTTSTTTGTEINNVEICITSIKQVKFDPWDEYEKNKSKVRVSALDSNVYKYERLFYYKSDSPKDTILSGGDGMTAVDPDFSLPISELPSYGYNIDTAYMSGLVVIYDLTKRVNGDDSGIINQKSFYFSNINLKSHNIDSLYANMFERFNWKVRLDITSNSCDIYSDASADAYTKYKIDYYIYQYGQCTDNNAHPA